MSKYGEPWSPDKGELQVYTVDAQRACACVNACAGLEDPSVLPDLLPLLEEALSVWETHAAIDKALLRTPEGLPPALQKGKLLLSQLKDGTPETEEETIFLTGATLMAILGDDWRALLVKAKGWDMLHGRGVRLTVSESFGFTLTQARSIGLVPGDSL